MGTGGTITGVGRYLKSRNPNIQIVGMDIEGSILTEIWQNKGKIPDGAYPKTYKVEGIGEDFLAHCARPFRCRCHRTRWRSRILFVGTSTRAAGGYLCGRLVGLGVAGAIKYCRKLPDGRFPVVILPDSGSRYLSKFYDDKWMREFGFLSMEFGEMALGDLLIANPIKRCTRLSLAIPMRKVVSMMHQHGISQMPVVGRDGALAGLIEEVDMLNHMLEKHEHSHG